MLEPDLTPFPQSSTMHPAGSPIARPPRGRLSRAALLAIGAVVAGLLAACSSDQVSAPLPSVSFGKSAADTAAGKMKPLKRTQPSSEAAVTKVIGRKGGTIELKESGLRVIFPVGALLDDVAITVSRVGSDDIAYEFEPHGLVFQQPVVFSQDLKGTEYDGATLLGSLQGAYFQYASQLGPDGADVNEVMNARLNKNRVEMEIWHFSGYMMSTGRTTTKTTSIY